MVIENKKCSDYVFRHPAQILPLLALNILNNHLTYIANKICGAE